LSKVKDLTVKLEDSLEELTEDMLPFVNVNHLTLEEDKKILTPENTLNNSGDCINIFSINLIYTHFVSFNMSVVHIKNNIILIFTISASFSKLNFFYV
jgi:hypothetical protein